MEGVGGRGGGGAENAEAKEVNINTPTHPAVVFHSFSRASQILFRLGRRGGGGKGVDTGKTS